MQTITIPQGNLTKNQEISLINEIYDTLPQESYLKMILKGLPGYCEEQIRSDFAVAPAETIETERRRAKKEKADLETKLVELEKLRMHAELQIKELNVNVNLLKAELQSAEKDIKQSRATSTRLQSEVNETKKINEKLHQDIIGLKAELYDMISTATANQIIEEKHEISRMITLSTAHLDKDTAELLTNATATSGYIKNLCVYEKGGYGWFLWYDADNEEANFLSLPECLQDIIAFARKNGNIEWICLDCDGPTEDELNIFEW